MILIAAAILGLGASLLGGGSWRHLADRPIRWSSLALLAVTAQLLAIRHGLDGGPVLGATILASQALLLAVVGANWRRGGFLILGAGLALNLLAMAANGGFMPVSPDSLVRLGESPEGVIGMVLPGSKSVVLAAEETRLWFLSDIFLLPPPFPIPTAFSLGDVLLAMGAFLIPRSMMGNHGAEGGLREAATERGGARSDLAHGAARPMLEH